MYDHLTDEETLLAWLAAGGDVALADDFGFTALHVAVLRGWGRARAALLSAGADPKAKTRAMATGSSRSRYIRPKGATFFASKIRHEVLREGEDVDKGATPLHLAASVGDLDAVEALLAAKARVVKDAVGATPVHLAALGGHTAVLERLLTPKLAVAATKVRKSLRFHDAGTTALHAALEAGSEPCVRALLAAGADPSATTEIGCSGVFFAARGGSVACLDAIAQPVDEDGEYLDWPLLEAVEAGHLAMVGRLLEGGASPENSRGQQSPLRTAIERQHSAIRQLLLDRGARPVEHRHPSSAARGNDTWWLRAAHARGVDLSAATDGSAPLMDAAAQGHVEATEVLLELGADPNVVSTYTALHVAVANDHVPVVDLLLAAGADCSLVDNHGNDVLATLAWRRWATVEQVRRALALGGNPHRQNRHGSCPADHLDRYDPAIAALFEDAAVPEDADAHAFRASAHSEVLAAADIGVGWKRLHTQLWDDLVPPSGEAPTVQGELLRCIGKLSDEAYRNGNINWGPRFVALLDTLESTLLDGTLEWGREQRLRGLIRGLRSGRQLDLSGDGSPHYVISEAVVHWCLAHRELIPR